VDYSDRAGALVMGIARTGDGPTMDRVVDVVLDSRWAPYARAAVRIQSRRTAGAGAGGAAVGAPPNPDELRHAKGDAPYPLPPDVAPLVQALKTTSDEALAQSFTRVLAAARSTGRLALYPDVVLERMAVMLRDARSGDRRTAAAVLEDYAERLEPVEGAADFHVASRRARRLAAQGQYAQAVSAQERAARIVARRGYDGDDGALWRRERAYLDALRGADLVLRGQVEPARDAFRRALLRDPFDVEILKSVARTRAQVGHDLEAAQAEALRAITIERRHLDRDLLDAADALSTVWLKQGRAQDAARLLGRHCDRNDPGGYYLLHCAEALVAAGDSAAALPLLHHALEDEPGLFEAVRLLPWTEPLRAQLAPDLARAEERVRLGSD
jgi:tetratricopeptide (TPR) repeat protein